VSWINPRLTPRETRRVLTGLPGKTGVVYTLDRATGKFLWAWPTVTQNVISSIDGATGDVIENAEVVFSTRGPGRAGLSHLDRRQGLGVRIHLSPQPNKPLVHWEDGDLNGSEAVRIWLAEPETAGRSAGSPDPSYPIAPRPAAVPW